MKILFSIYYLGLSHYVATTHIILRLTKELSKLGAECHIIGPHSFEEDMIAAPNAALHPFEFGRYCDAVIRERFTRANGKSFTKARKAWALLCHPIRAVRQAILNRHIKRCPELTDHYIMNISRITREQHFDAVVGVYFPIDVLKAFAKMDIGTATYLYQMDPWALHESPYRESVEERTVQEMAAFKKATHIFTTGPLYSQYCQNVFRPHTYKMTPLEFPNLEVVPCAADATFPFRPEGLEGDARPFIFVYTGFINDEFRNPEYFLQVFDIFRKMKPETHLFAMGGLESKNLERYAQKHPHAVTLLKRQTAQTARLCLETADLMVNIDNTFTNQVPSKLMDYFSTGNKMVTVLKLKNSPSLPKLNKYPLNLNLAEGGDPQNDAQRLLTFCEENAKRRVPFEDVYNIFYESTPQYVADKMLQVMEETAF